MGSLATDRNAVCSGCDGSCAVIDPNGKRRNHRVALLRAPQPPVALRSCFATRFARQLGASQAPDPGCGISRLLNPRNSARSEYHLSTSMKPSRCAPKTGSGTPTYWAWAGWKHHVQEQHSQRSGFADARPPWATKVHSQGAIATLSAKKFRRCSSQHYAACQPRHEQTTAVRGGSRCHASCQSPRGAALSPLRWCGRLSMVAVESAH